MQRNASTPRRSRWSRSAFLLIGGGVSVSLLFWAKLRVVTNIPRTTYAEPTEEQGDPDALQVVDAGEAEREAHDDAARTADDR